MTQRHLTTLNEALGTRRSLDKPRAATCLCRGCAMAQDQGGAYRKLSRG